MRKADCDVSYNIQIQTSSILVIVLIMLFFFCSRKIGLFTERVFARILIGAFVCLLLDIISVVFICNDDVLHPGSLKLPASSTLRPSYVWLSPASTIS